MKRTDYQINPEKMFSGDLMFLSNLYACEIPMNVLGHPFVFGSAEAAFQAGKCLDPGHVQLFTRVADGAAAKKLGERVPPRKDWDMYRLAWMKQVLTCKFTRNPELMKKLIDTYPLPLTNTNTWGDTFWGVCQGVGEDHLGRLLTQLRNEHLPESYPLPEGLDVLQFTHMEQGFFPWNF